MIGMTTVTNRNLASQNRVSQKVESLVNHVRIASHEKAVSRENRVSLGNHESHADVIAVHGEKKAEPAKVVLSVARLKDVRAKAVRAKDVGVMNLASHVNLGNHVVLNAERSLEPSREASNLAVVLSVLSRGRPLHASRSRLRLVMKTMTSITIMMTTLASIQIPSTKMLVTLSRRTVQKNGLAAVGLDDVGHVDVRTKVNGEFRLEQTGRC